MRKLFIILLAAVVLVGCKKENKIEKNLWKKGGEWNIAEWQEKGTYNYNTNYNYDDIMYNPGVIKFNKDGSGEISIKDGTDAYKEKFTYENTENTLTIYYENGYGIIFDLDWKKNEFTMSNKRNDTYQDGSIIETINLFTRILCKKKK